MVKVGRYEYKKSTKPSAKLMVVVEKDGKKVAIGMDETGYTDTSGYGVG